MTTTIKLTMFLAGAAIISLMIIETMAGCGQGGQCIFL